MREADFPESEATQQHNQADTIGSYYASMLVYEAGVVHPGIVERMSPQQLAQTALALVLTRDHLQATHGGRLLKPRRSSLVASLVQAESLEAAQSTHPGVPVSHFLIELDTTIADLREFRQGYGGLHHTVAQQLELLSTNETVAEPADGALAVLPQDAEQIQEPDYNVGQANLRYARLLPPSLKRQIIANPDRNVRELIPHCLDPQQGCEVIGELGRLKPKRAVLTTELPAKLGFTAEEHGPYVDYLLKISPYRWKVVTKNVFEPDNDIAWLEEADADAFAEWAKGARQEKSAIGMLAELTDLDIDEFGALDKSLFDLQNSQGIQPDLTSLIANAAILTTPTETFGRLDAVEINALMSLFLWHEKPATVADDLVKQETIKPPERPLVTNLSRYYARHLDGFLVEALGKLL